MEMVSMTVFGYLILIRRDFFQLYFSVISLGLSVACWPQGKQWVLFLQDPQP